MTSAEQRAPRWDDQHDLDQALVPPGQESVAAYVADMSAQLSRMAQTVRLDVLAYLLDMARLEAETACDDVKAWEAEE